MARYTLRWWTDTDGDTLPGSFATRAEAEASAEHWRAMMPDATITVAPTRTRSTR